MFKSVQLTDSNFDKPGSIDITVGPHDFGDGKLDEEDGLRLRYTVFGWVVSGKSVDSFKQFHTTKNVFRSDMIFDLSPFWKLEEGPRSPKLTAEEQGCEEQFQRITTQNEGGRFVVQLLSNDAIPPIGESYLNGKQRLMNLEQQLIVADVVLSLCQGVSWSETLDRSTIWWIADTQWRGVLLAPSLCAQKTLNEDKTASGLRRLCEVRKWFFSEPFPDGRFSCSIGSVFIPFGFHFHAVALFAEIAKMCKQFALNLSSRDFYWTLWRDNPREFIRHLRMTRVTNGAASSAFHSTRCLVEIGTSSSDKDLRNATHNSFYVDDFLAGADTPEEAGKFLWKLYHELQRYAFELRKWSTSTSGEFLSLPENIHGTTGACKFMDEVYRFKTLEIKWTPNRDFLCIQCQVELCLEQNQTNSVVKNIKAVSSQGLAWTDDNRLQVSPPADLERSSEVE